MRGRSDICTACALCLCGGRGFCPGGVRILAAAGCDALVFGAETPDAALLMEAARVLNSAAYRTELKRQLAAGARSFAAARQAAVEALCPGTALAALLDKPNNNLAVEYCKAILEQEAPMTPVPLPRVGAGHGQALAESGHTQFASASALRALWAEQGAECADSLCAGKSTGLYKKAEIDGCIRIMPLRAGVSWLCCGRPVHDRNLLPQCGAFPRGWTTGWRTPCAAAPACPSCWTR